MIVFMYFLGKLSIFHSENADCIKKFNYICGEIIIAPHTITTITIDDNKKGCTEYNPAHPLGKNLRHIALL